jgi:prolipoprotein diacylglyceryltransferase
MNAGILAALFFVMSHPSTYKTLDTLIAPLFGRWFKAFEGGCPTHGGVMFHSMAFFGAVLALGYL